ncbi:hypothetical protein TEA_026475 [Camellia sinensis var. sinensis]|uniref:non-specific serine/threonine protein kinase n=1 Tax=Camellia sinensis var. sinensis TaxID=542762 RepID=A0A4S4DE85_CAMSN|nr:hypothetical protein TEA_026475 [Camellia sinensis var. sinensis]
MAVCNSWPWNPLPSPIMLCSLFFFIYFPLHATALNFNFTNFNETNSSIILEGQATVSTQGIQIIPPKETWKAGRATYKDPLQLGDIASGTLADFNTHFSFIIDSKGNSTFADGFAFSLLPNNSASMNAYGAAMGLPILSISPPRATAFVAVEFDTFPNFWDPAETHVGDLYENHIVKSWSFNSSLQIDVPTSPSLSPSPSPSSILIPSPNATSSSRKKGGNNKNALVMGLSVGSSALVGGLALLGFVKWKKSRAPEEDGKNIAPDMSMDDEFDAGIGPKKFLYAELFHATNNFADKQKLGEGGFGGVYKGFLRESNSYVAVKRISKGSKQGIKEYASEVKIISRLRHRNLVQLLGWCHDKNELLLVYEFMENGSLDNHLFNEKSVLTWAVRYKIAQGLASALLYLHEGWEQCMVHRDVKSNNVMLDSNFNTKIGDFGLARFVDHGKNTK